MRASASDSAEFHVKSKSGRGCLCACSVLNNKFCRLFAQLAYFRVFIFLRSTGSSDGL